ncbi:MAG: MBL fold metallo-hydrolase [Gammaproteobacteria bacterium]|nr:MBL fold metallo-hydrolase [Gammaproteobacteria bacterium]
MLTQPLSFSRFFQLCCFLLASLILSNATSADELLLRGEDWLAAAESNVVDITTAELLELSKANPQIELIDVRTEFEIAHTGGLIDVGRRTHALSRGWLEFRIGETIPDLNTEIVVYCGTNLRSPLAAATLKRMGYTRVYNYQDGFPAWLDANLPVAATDEMVGSMLFRQPIEVQSGVWSAIGATAPPTYENSGHNNNLSFVIGSDAVLVVNASDNYLLAKALHEEIKTITSLPVEYVVLENGQGHAMLGTNYWQEQGAKVIAHVDTASVMAAHGQAVLDRMKSRNRDKSMGTVLSAPDITFEDRYELNLGDMAVEVLYLGPSHSPGDTQVWLPKRQLMIAGDMAFHERLLPVFDDTDTAGWIETWRAFKALDAQVIIPGHGHPTTIEVVETWTIDYLKYMRQEIGKILEDGGSLIDAYNIDQSVYAHLDTFDELAGLNADRIFRSMEFE